MSSVKAIVMKVRKRIEKIVEAQLATLERVLISHSLEMLADLEELSDYPKPAPVLDPALLPAMATAEPAAL